MPIHQLKEKVKAISSRIHMVRGRGEEATKQALVLPMLDALGYDIWNPTEVCPEFEADFAIKKAGQKEKVDLAVVLNNEPRVFIEVKPVDFNLDGHQGQLARYFNGIQAVTLGVLTNGVEYRFFSDTYQKPNMLDEMPFHVFRVDNHEQPLDVLLKFHKVHILKGAVRDLAAELVSTAKITEFLRNELDVRSKEPSDELVRWIMRPQGINYDGKVVESVVQKFRPLVKAALQNVLKEIVRRSIAALDEGVTAAPQTAAEAPTPLPTVAEPIADDAAKGGVVTTDAELAAFAVIKDIFNSHSTGSRTIYDGGSRRDLPVEIGFKDTTGYFGVYFNKPACWFIRMQIEARHPWVGFNLDLSTGQSLLPLGFALLPANSFSDVRVAITKPEDLNALSKLVIAATEYTIAERKPRSES